MSARSLKKNSRGQILFCFPPVFDLDFELIVVDFYKNTKKIARVLTLATKNGEIVV